jgi:hypothetical protein
MAGLPILLADRTVNQVNANQKKGGATANVFLVIFGIFWCSLVAGFDFFIFRTVVSQVASTWFQPTGARILRSEVTRHHDSEGGTTHGVRFEYTYSVNGTSYTGTRYTFDGESSSDSQWARDAVAEFPAGAERTCYYDPQNPSRAVLARGLHGSDITHLMFITPFNVVAGFFIAYPIWMWRERRKPMMVEPRFADRLHGREGYALNQCGPILSFSVLFFLTSFVGIFAVVCTGGFHPTMAKVVTIWGAGFAIAVGISAYLQMKTRSGRYDLVFDQNARTITVPAVQKRKVVETIPMAEVQKFDVERVESGSGDDHKVTWQLKMVADGGREMLLEESYFERQAKRLAETLNAKLKA